MLAYIVGTEYIVFDIYSVDYIHYKWSRWSFHLYVVDYIFRVVGIKYKHYTVSVAKGGADHMIASILF